MVQEFEDGAERVARPAPSTYWDEPQHIEPYNVTLTGVVPTRQVARLPIRLWGWIVAGPVDAYDVDVYDGQNTTGRLIAKIMNLAGVPHIVTLRRPILCSGGLFLDQNAGSPVITLLIERLRN